MLLRGSNRWSWVLIPFSWLYGLVVSVRNAFYDRRIFSSESFRVPLISVGNLSAGGTGKTPHIEYLAGLLKPGYRVATLSRGYMRRTKGFRLATAQSVPDEVGDEPLQLKIRHPDITVAVDRDRVNGVKRLMEMIPPAEVVLLDDAFQHRSVKPGLSMVLMDYHRPVDRDLLLPAGRLREPLRSLNRADGIIVTRSPGEVNEEERRQWRTRLKLSERQSLFYSTVEYGSFLSVYTGTPPLLKDQGIVSGDQPVEAILLVTGIAHPEGLKEFISNHAAVIHHLRYPDHHEFSRSELRKIERNFVRLKEKFQRAMVLTTEKDAMRLRQLEPGEILHKSVFAIRIHIRFLSDDQEKFDNQILEYVRNQKSS